MSGEHWITCFQDTAEALLGRNAADLGAIKETQDENQLDNVFVNSTFNSWVFRLRAKIDNFNVSSNLPTLNAHRHMCDQQLLLRSDWLTR